MGHIVTVSTIQLDFLLPERFELEYKDENGQSVRPVMVHLGHIGTYERYLAMLLEQTKGVLPLWLAPTQIIILPVNNELHGYFSQQLFDKLRTAGFRVEIDDRNERLSKRMRDAQISKIPYQLIIGDEEMKNFNMITYRRYGSEDSFSLVYDEFVQMLDQEIAKKSRQD